MLASDLCHILAPCVAGMMLELSKKHTKVSENSGAALRGFQNTGKSMLAGRFPFPGSPDIGVSFKIKGQTLLKTWKPKRGPVKTTVPPKWC